MCGLGLEAAAADEASALGFAVAGVEVGGVHLGGDTREALRANLSVAIPTRVLVRVARFEARDFATLERRVRALDWSRFGRGFAPRAACHASRLHHTGAIEERLGRWLPAGETALLVRFDRDVCTLSVDTSGERLHKRGWRVETGPAPLRETLAAGLLRLAGWAPGEALYDPMCGSGTLLIEAACAAQGLRPGRLRAFDCEARLEHGLRARVLERPTPIIPTTIVGSDRAKPAIEAAKRNAERAGVEAALTLSVLEAAHAQAPAAQGLLVCNLPYDRRAAGAAHAAERLRRALDGPFAAWRAAVLTPDPRIAAQLDRGVTAVHAVDNGGLRVEWTVLSARS